MFALNRFYSIVFCVIILFILGPRSWAQDGQQGQYWGMGLTPQYEIPSFKFNDRFSGGPNIGLKFSYVYNRTIYEITCFTSKFSNGKIEETAFQWNLDGEFYPSPNAKSEYISNGVIGSLKIPFSLSFGPIVPYSSVGAGFVYYEHKIHDLIFPGQSILPLDPSFMYSPEDESQTSFNINFGGGLRYMASMQLAIDLNVRYNFVFGYLRPMEAWLLEKVSPIQTLGIGLDLTYYITK